MLAASGVVCEGGDEVRNSASSGVARWLTLGSCSSQRGTPSSSMQAFFPAAPSSSSKTSGPVPTGCMGTFAFVMGSSPGIKSSSASATPSGAIRVRVARLALDGSWLVR